MPILIGAMAPDPPPEIRHALIDASNVTGVPFELLRSVAYVESRYKPGARNPKSGASGLMQLMPATAKGLDVDPFNPVLAARAGGKLLAHWRQKYRGSWAHALAAYNWGPGKVDRAGGWGRTDGWPSSVRRYVEKVLEGAGMPRPFRVRIAGEMVL
jgi:soluble lytic murein transglycosylase-like protein